jgi:hypothetical protein
MTTRDAAPPNADEPWQSRVLKGGDDPAVTTKTDTPNPVAVDGADDPSDERDTNFLPRFQRTPDGKAWS